MVRCCISHYASVASAVPPRRRRQADLLIISAVSGIKMADGTGFYCGNDSDMAISLRSAMAIPEEEPILEVRAISISVGMIGSRYEGICISYRSLGAILRAGAICCKVQVLSDVGEP